MRIYTNKEEKQAFFDGARAIMRALSLIPEAECRIALTNKGEQHILALLQQAKETEDAIRARDIRTLLQYGRVDKDCVYEFILQDQNAKMACLPIRNKDSDQVVTTLQPNDKVAAQEAVRYLVLLGDRDYLYSRIGESTLPEERKYELRYLVFHVAGTTHVDFSHADAFPSLTDANIHNGYISHDADMLKLMETKASIPKN